MVRALPGKGEMTDNVLSLPLNRVLPDPEQPRQRFDPEAMERLKAAIYTVGQLHPIRVRFTDEGWMIVDGQRRWLALCALAKEHPNEPQFQTIRAVEGDAGLDNERSMRLSVQVLSNCGEDLTPMEKARALDEISNAEPELSAEDLAQRLGVPKGQVQFLQQLACAPAFIQELARGTNREALPLWNLITLIRLLRKLRKWDDQQFRNSTGAHERVAEREVKRLAARAVEERWGKRKLQMEADRVVRRVTGETVAKEQRDKGSSLDRVRRVLADLGGLPEDERGEVISLLKSTLDQLEPETNRSAGRASRKAAQRDAGGAS